MIHQPGNTEFISIVLKIRHSIQGSKHDSYSKIYFTASENTKTHQVYAKVSEYQSRSSLLTEISNAWDIKFVNLQYNTLLRWFAGTNDSPTKHLMFQALMFFIISYRLRALKTLYFYFCIVIEKKKKN